MNKPNKGECWRRMREMVGSTLRIAIRYNPKRWGLRSGAKLFFGVKLEGRKNDQISQQVEPEDQ